MPARNGQQPLPQRLYCVKGSKVALKLSAKLPAKGTLVATVSTPNGKAIAQNSIGSGTKPRNTTGKVPQTGWQNVVVNGAGLPTAGIGFRLDVTYTGAST